jgi:hypothetical protein
VAKKAGKKRRAEGHRGFFDLLSLDKRQMKKTKEVSSALLFAFFLFFQTQRERERESSVLVSGERVFRE